MPTARVPTIAMDGNDRELGWEDVGGNVAAGMATTAALGAVSGAMGQLGDGRGGEGPMSDVVTTAMVSHLAREFSKGSMSYFPAFVEAARRYFNVTHGYVLRKLAWQLVPMTSTKKKASEGELGGEKDWTTRVFEGLEVDIEEPDLYIPTMAFVTYVLLCGMIHGLQEQFKPEVLASTVNYAVFLMIVEALVCKAVLFSAGATNAPAVDLTSMLGYKYFYISVQMVAGLILGWGYKPQGFFFGLISLGLFVSCGIALWQALRRLPRMQPTLSKECVSDVHKLLIKAIPVLQALVIWALLPRWPGPRPAKLGVAKEAVAAAVAALETTVTTLAPLAANATA